MAYVVVKSNRGVEESLDKTEFLIDSSSDVSNLPDNAAPGSMAYTASLSDMYMKSASGTWTKIGG